MAGWSSFREGLVGSTDFVLGEGLGLGLDLCISFEADSRKSFLWFSHWRGFALAESLIFVSSIVLVSFLIFV